MKGICQECGKFRKIVIHHKDENHLNDVVSNRRALCYRCHLVVHGRADRGTGQRSEYLPTNWRPGPILWTDIRQQYFVCFPRA